jgi:hypothetical protein
VNIQSLKRRVAGMGLGGGSDVLALAADKILSVPKSGSSLAAEFLTGPGPRLSGIRMPAVRGEWWMCK